MKPSWFLIRWSLAAYCCHVVRAAVGSGQGTVLRGFNSSTNERPTSRTNKLPIQLTDRTSSPWFLPLVKQLKEGGIYKYSLEYLGPEFEVVVDTLQWIAMKIVGVEEFNEEVIEETGQLIENEARSLIGKTRKWFKHVITAPIQDVAVESVLYVFAFESSRRLTMYLWSEFQPIFQALYEDIKELLVIIRLELRKVSGLHPYERLVHFAKIVGPWTKDVLNPLQDPRQWIQKVLFPVKRFGLWFERTPLGRNTLPVLHVLQDLWSWIESIRSAITNIAKLPDPKAYLPANNRTRIPDHSLLRLPDYRKTDPSDSEPDRIQQPVNIKRRHSGHRHLHHNLTQQLPSSDLIPSEVNNASKFFEAAQHAVRQYKLGVKTADAKMMDAALKEIKEKFTFIDVKNWIKTLLSVLNSDDAPAHLKHHIRQLLVNINSLLGEYNSLNLMLVPSNPELNHENTKKPPK